MSPADPKTEREMETLGKDLEARMERQEQERQRKAQRLRLDYLEGLADLGFVEQIIPAQRVVTLAPPDVISRVKADIQRHRTDLAGEETGMILPSSVDGIVGPDGNPLRS